MFNLEEVFARNSLVHLVELAGGELAKSGRNVAAHAFFMVDTTKRV